MNPPELPNRNPLYPWLRVLLWLVPAGFVLIAGVGISLLARPLRIPEPAMIGLWIVVSLLFTGAAGWCDHRLAADDSATKTYQPWLYVILFVLGQLIGVPLVLGVAMFGVCVVFAR